MPPRKGSSNTPAGGYNRFASLSDISSAAKAESSADTAQSSAVPSEPSTPRTRSAAKRAASATKPSQATRVSVQKTEEDVQKAKAAPKPAAQKNDVDASQSYWKKVRDRTLFTFLMIGGFMTILLMGPAYLILLVLLLDTMVYREITGLFKIPGRASLTDRPNAEELRKELDPDECEEHRRQELWSKTLSWYFFAVCNFFLYGESLVYYFKHIVYVDSFFLYFARHHRLVSFMLYIFGFMAFVARLKRGNLKYQFGLFCWVHMSLLLIAISSHFIVNNILEGIIWFWVPVSLVICNDIFAYICGMMFGRTPLIKLSPKKTVEGFIGALLITMCFAWFYAGFFQQFNYMICPSVNLGMNAFSGVQCNVNPVFHMHTSALPDTLATILSTIARRPVTQFHWTYFQFHALVMAAFASLVAPFGGFFASGFKRAFEIKDFGDSIPGHGGLTDRFDCQFIMGLFSFVYYSAMIRDNTVTVGMVMQTIITQLSVDQQVALHEHLQHHLRSAVQA
ncbi:phosphatidate cytidylyltransferase [Malassezia vespertilionis]|uniref:Phosphatidate cytidylyltransferase n=1 Tax=Malassezia vespertilionis TaxID=2020962 RepID=A0A2N1JF17_9BASI|nr:phosphatidate cytidylyltransferase [Malassezia vespertilionis]PKI85143.1 hypothetical protein MVES_001101 [Malassezia vespertilionis]WFD05833.1 phosphatidate cytidylyltransferase [Malassezia vespertilionis]